MKVAQIIIENVRFSVFFAVHTGIKKKSDLSGGSLLKQKGVKGSIGLIRVFLAITHYETKLTSVAAHSAPKMEQFVRSLCV